MSALLHLDTAVCVLLYAAALYLAAGAVGVIAGWLKGDDDHQRFRLQ
jgi:hypothetical protein